MIAQSKKAVWKHWTEAIVWKYSDGMISFYWDLGDVDNIKKKIPCWGVT